MDGEMYASQQQPELQNFKEPRYIKGTDLLNVRKSTEYRKSSNLGPSQTLVASQSQAQVATSSSAAKAKPSAGRYSESFRTMEAKGSSASAINCRHQA